MANPWFRMYAEFSHDPKVQMMPEDMQRRYIMVLCLRCSNTLVTLHETEIAFHLRISDVELASTKALFIAKGFIDEEWNVLNWDKRQFASDSSAERVARHRANKKQSGNDDVTLRKRKCNTLDTDTDTDTEIPPNPPSPDGDEGAESEASAKPKRERKPRIALKTFLASCKANEVKPVTSYKPLMEYVDGIKLPAEFLELAWDVFCREHLPGGANEKRLQAEWQKHFFNYVSKGYYRLWVCKPDGSFELTSVGNQAKAREAA